MCDYALPIYKFGGASASSQVGGGAISSPSQVKGAGASLEIQSDIHPNTQVFSKDITVIYLCCFKLRIVTDLGSDHGAQCTEVNETETPKTKIAHQLEVNELKRQLKCIANERTPAR